MSRCPILFFLFTFLCLAISCCEKRPVEDRSPQDQYVFNNDTDYDCLIIWDQPEDGAGQVVITGQQVMVLSGDTYIQTFSSFNTSGLASDGKSYILLGKNSKVKFVSKGDKEVAFEYSIPYDESVRKSTRDCFWTDLPHYNYQLVDTPDMYCCVATFFLSDILSLILAREM